MGEGAILVWKGMVDICGEEGEREAAILGWYKWEIVGGETERERRGYCVVQETMDSDGWGGEERDERRLFLSDEFFFFFKT